MSRLAIIDTDRHGQPVVLEEFGTWTPGEFREYMESAFAALEANRLAPVAHRNEARLTMLLDAAAHAGLFAGDGRVNLDPVLRPYVDCYLVEYEQRKRLHRRVEKWFQHGAKRFGHFLVKITVQGAGGLFRKLWKEIRLLLKF